MTLVRWTPLRELAAMQDRMNRLFEDTFKSPLSDENALTARDWVPVVDIYETEKEIVLKAELPEIKEKEIEIKVEDNTLILQGERKMEADVKEENYHRVERSYGAFSRSFRMPHTVDSTKIKAAYKDGVLKISLPKREEAKPKQIKIDIG